MTDATATLTPAQIKAALQVCLILGEAIREAKEIPSGHLYAMVMDKLELNQYQGAINLLKRQGLIRESGHLLTWIGD